MKREDFERLKEKEKAHLRDIRKLKRRLHEAERVRSIGKALNDIESAGSMDEIDEALRRVQLEALEGESRLDIALQSNQDSEQTQKPDLAEMEAELSKAKAAELVKHMKLSMGLQDRDSKPTSSSVSSRGSISAQGPESSDVVDLDRSAPKTIGRMSRMNRGDE